MPRDSSTSPTQSPGLMMWRQRVLLFIIIILVTFMIFTTNINTPPIPKYQMRSTKIRSTSVRDHFKPIEHLPREPQDEAETVDTSAEDDDPTEIENEHTDNSDFNIYRDDQYKLEFEMGGYIFNEKGRSKELKSKIVSSLIHNFSPYIERETEKRFIDPPHTNIYFANSPATVWHHGEIILISRVWLDREIYEPKDTWPANHFADNWLFTQKFDKYLKPTNPGSIMGIPLPKQWWVGDGPIEPRLTVYRDKVFVTFNAAMAYDMDKHMDFTIIWDYAEQKPIIPNIKGGSPMMNATAKGDMPRDKHWMALVENDKLYFVHNLDPLRVMECDLEGYCEFIHNEVNKDKFIFSDHVSHLRGGTPFEHYEGKYFISIAHVTLYKKKNGNRYYTANLVVLCTDPYKIVYVSNDIKIHSYLYESIPMVRSKYIKDGFFFPVGLIIENKDTITVGGHINDHSSVLIRLRGIEALMREVIDTADQQQAKSGPPVHYLQNHVHQVLQNLTRIEFVH